jgi:hypothetical protein
VHRGGTSPAAPAPLSNLNVKSLTALSGAQVFLRAEGVERVTSGFAGGRVPDPSYREVVSGRTGHAEARHPSPRSCHQPCPRHLSAGVTRGRGGWRMAAQVVRVEFDSARISLDEAPAPPSAKAR